MSPWVPAGEDLQSLLARLLLTLLFVPMLGAALTLLHELAHAVTARLLGLRVFVVSLGSGPVLAVWRFLGIRWDVRLVPLGGGSALGGPPSPSFRWRLFLSTLAGPAAHVLVLPWLALPLVAPASGLHAPVAVILLEAALWLDLVLLLAILWPFKAKSVYGEVGSDGLRLLQLLLEPEHLDEMHVAYYMLEALDSYELGDWAAARRWAEEATARYPDRAEAIGGLGVILLQMGEVAQARRLFVRALEASDEGREAAHAIRLNNVAFADVASGDPALLAEADRYSAEAYAIMPQMPGIMGTRGAVLVELGQVDEGLALLRRSLATRPDDPSRALTACHIALGEKRRGNLAAAQRYLQAARSYDAHCFLIPRVAGELSGGGALGASGPL